MVEKIRLTLWDIFSSFLTGFIFLILVLVIMINYNHISLSECLIFVKALPTVIVTLILILLGLIIEP